MKKRFLSLLLALVMILGMLPATTLTANAATSPAIPNLHRGVLDNCEDTDYVYWDEVEEADYYKVEIYRDGAFVTNDTVWYYRDLECRISGSDKWIVENMLWFYKAGTYTVKVTAYEEYGDQTRILAASEISFDVKKEEQVATNIVWEQNRELVNVKSGENVKFTVGKDSKSQSMAITKSILDKAKCELAYVKGVDWLSATWNEDDELELVGTVPNNCPKGEYTVYVGFKSKNGNAGFVFECAVMVSGTTYVSQMLINPPHFIPTYWEIYNPHNAGFEYSYPRLTVDIDGKSFIADWAGETDGLRWNDYVDNLKEFTYDRCFYLNLFRVTDTGARIDVSNSEHTIIEGKYEYVWTIPLQDFDPDGNEVVYTDDLKVYLGNYSTEVDKIERVDDSNDKLKVYEYYYVYDVKPEIHSVSVNGESFTDGATHTLNSQNVTIKTTYDSTLSAAMLEYGCTSVKALSQWYVNGVKVNKAAVSPVDNGDGTATKTLTHTLNGGDVLEIRNWLEVTWPDGTTDIVDEHTMTVKAPISEVNVGATWSGTPANATSNTNGITVTSTKWYKKNGSSWTQLGASDTIKEGGSYRCEVTVAATNGYTLADGYTVKINGTAATKKSGNTWYRDVTITGISDYVEVNDIDLPEAFTNPDFTYDTSDVAPSRKHWDVAKVEWFECDKDGKKLSDALPADHIFEKGGYYRVEVTVVPETNWQFHGSALGFYINGKAANYLYGYNKAYTDSVTGYLVYNTADIEGDYELFVYDDSLSGSAKNIYIKDGQYLGSNATGATAIKPASGGYAYYKDGVLTLNGYDNEKAHFYFEELALELYLVGDNTIGAIYDNEWGHASNLEVRQGNLVIDAADGGKLTIASNPLDAYANIQVKDLYFNGGELTSCLANGTYGAAVQLNGGNLYLENGYVAYVSDTNNFASATKWDRTIDISDYDCVWIVEEQATVTHTVTFKVGTATVDTRTVEDGKTVTAPTAPTQSGKTFLGWYTEGGQKYDFSKAVTGDITLIAKFKDNASGDVLLGDVNLDGQVNSIDSNLLKRSVAGEYIIESGSPAALNADINGDGQINSIDSNLLKRMVAGDYRP